MTKRKKHEGEWVGGIISTPFLIQEKGPCQPDLAVWIDVTRECIVGFELHTPPTSLEKVADLLESSMRHPVVGPPRRPQKVRVENEDLAELIRSRFGAKIHVEVGPVPELEAVAEDLFQMLEEPAGATTYLEDESITPEQVGRFFEAAARLYRVAPWETVDDCDLFEVDIPVLDVHEACISIIGALGESFGYIIFRSIEDYERLVEFSSNTPEEVPSMGIPLFSVNFDRGSEIPQALRKEISRHRWEVASADAYPTILKISEDGLRLPLRSQDYLMATACSEALARFFTRHGEDLEEGTDLERPISGKYLLKDLPGSPTVKIKALPLLGPPRLEEGEGERLEDKGLPDPQPPRQLSLWEAPAQGDPPQEVTQADMQDDVIFMEKALGMNPRPPSHKIGRNEPCPCGSGKKYKKCCLNKIQPPSDLLWILIREAHDRLMPRLLKFATRFGKEQGLQEAIQEFLPDGEDDPSEALKGQDQLFVPWFLFNWIPEKGPSGRRPASKTIAEHYVESERARLDALGQRLIQETAGRPFSFYEVLHCQPGVGVRLRDIFTGEEKEVKEKSGSQSLGVGDILFARWVSVDHVTILVGCGALPLPPSFKPDLIRLRKEFRRIHRKVTPKVLSQYQEDLRFWYLEACRDLKRPPQVRNTDGDPILFHTIHYEIDSPQTAFEALKFLSVEETEEELLHDAKRDHQGNLVEVTIPWIRKGREKDPHFGSTLLGSIHIQGRKMTVEVNSERRARKIQREIKRRLGDRAVYKTTVTTALESFQQSDPGGPPAERKKEQKALEIPEIREYFQEMARHRWMSWMDEKIPALGGKTPRQAVKTRDGKESVEALILDAQRRMDPDDVFGEASLKALEEIRKELGLD